MDKETDDRLNSLQESLNEISRDLKRIAFVMVVYVKEHSGAIRAEEASEILDSMLPSEDK